MKFIKARSIPLTIDEKSAFLNDHLPYRIKILETVNQYQPQVNTDIYWPSIYESAQITCRMFVEFFGFAIDGDNPPKLKEDYNYYSRDKKTSYEVKIKDLGFDFVTLGDLTPHEQTILAHAYECGNRATAHLTYGHPFVADPIKVLEASQIIRKLVKDKLHI